MPLGTPEPTTERSLWAPARAKAPCQPSPPLPVGVLGSRGPFVPWQPLGRFALSLSLPSSSWDVCLTAHAYFS